MIQPLAVSSKAHTLMSESSITGANSLASSLRKEECQPEETMKKMTTFTAPLALLAAITLVSTPAFAQDHGGQGRRERSGQESRGRNGERAQPRAEAPPPQAPPPQAEARQQPPRRSESQRQGEDPRVQGRRDVDRRGEVGRAVPRREVIVPRGGYAPRYVPRVYAPRSFYRPYVFRPRVSIGFGVFAGFPVPYTYSYPYPISVYGYSAPRAPVMVTPESPYYGGVALEITPFDADVYVDGTYAGRVEDFDGTRQPLTLTAGTHRLEVQAPGYEPMIVDVGVQAGQVIPYRGDLQRY